MTTHDEDAGLEAPARAALLRWLADHDTGAPAGFADRVLACRREPGAAHDALADDEPLLPPFVALPIALPRKRPVRRWLAVGTSVLAAAALVMFIARTLRAGVEADERAVRVAAAEIPASAELLAMRTAALATLQQQCMPCHSRSSADAVPGALEVFDVEDPRWYLSMSDRQLGVAARRIDGTGIAAAEREGFHAYVDGEIAHRASGHAL
ncbi:MAG TPA: hypothetical protein VFG69_12360 [Nannocystaceae bacterium]|nr:hypothetical protein [Nannocystaceae bacterium]